MKMSHEIRSFFFPLFLKHNSIFLLLVLSGIISGVFSVLMPVLLKWETDQLMERQFFYGLSPFEVFV